jgi:DNA-binding NarL/FixJ family response regulator
VSIRILLSDDHKMVRKGLSAVLQTEKDMEVVGEASNGREALELARQCKPDVVIMDIAMPDMSGIEATRAIKAELPATRVIALSMYERREYVRQAIKAGADGYLLKTDAPEELIAAVRKLCEGQSVFSLSLDRNLIEEARTGTRERQAQELTGREAEILRLIAQGGSNRHIAGSLEISPRTVAVHRLNLMKKLNVHNAPTLLIRAEELGLLQPRA